MKRQYFNILIHSALQATAKFYTGKYNILKRYLIENIPNPYLYNQKYVIDLLFVGIDLSFYIKCSNISNTR